MLVQPPSAATECEVDRARKRAASCNRAQTSDTEQILEICGALCDAVALWLSHEGGRSFDPQAFDFVLEIAGHVVGAMIVTQLQSTRHPGRDGSEAPMHPLAHRLQGLEAIGRPRCMNADEFRIGGFPAD